MIALRYDRFGEPSEVVAPVDVAMPQPGEHDVRLRMVRSPIHNHDLATIRGVYGVKPQLPATPGSEMVGIVDALGSGVTGLRREQRVVTAGPGAWVQYALVDARGCIPVPDAISDNDAGQLLAMPMSAIVLLDELRVEAGDWIVQTAAGGAVGRMLMRLAQARGVNVLGLVRREETAEALRRWGAQHVVVTGDDAWPERARAITGGAVARVVDSVCDATSIPLLRLLRRNGEYVVFGALGAQPLKIDPGPLIFNELIVRGFWMSAWMQRADNAQRADAIRRSIEHTLNGDIVLPVDATFPLERASEALRAAERPGRVGKILFAPNGS